jgi:hypothetical protein
MWLSSVFNHWVILTLLYHNHRLSTISRIGGHDRQMFPFALTARKVAGGGCWRGWSALEEKGAKLTKGNKEGGEADLSNGKSLP